MDAVAITELEKIDATRVDGVGVPANGIPILLMKAVAPVAKGSRDCPKCSKDYDADHQGSTCENCGADLPDAPASKAAEQVDCPTCKGDGKIMGDKRDCPDCDAKGKVTPDKAKTLAAKSLPGWHADAVALVKKAMVRGKVDESADIDGGNQAIALVGKLIGYEAQELAAGNLGEAADVALLAEAAQLLRQWVAGESAVQDGNVMPATALMQSAAKSGPTKAERDQAASEGNALSDGSYPIRNEHELHAAAILARSGHGDVEGAKKLIARRAKELGVPNPLDDDGDTSKSAIAQGGVTVDNGTQTGDLTEVVKAADAKAAALEKRVTDQQSVIEALEGRLAKVEAAAVPGGPVMSVTQPKTAGDGEDHAAKALYFDEWAERISDPSQKDHYRQLAARERAKILS